MLKDVAEKYYNQGYNCAESLVRAANEYYDLKLDDHSLRMVAGFGGGMQVGDICGALSGAICALSSQYVATKAHDSEDLRPVTVDMVKNFQQHFGSRICAKIKPTKFHPTDHCLYTVSEAAEILENTIKDYNNK